MKIHGLMGVAGKQTFISCMNPWIANTYE